SRGVEVPPGRFGDVRVEVDGGDQAVVAEPVGQQGGVVAAAGADLQDPLSVPYVQAGQHQRHQGGLAAGGEQLAVAQPDRQRRVLVRSPQPPLPCAGGGVLAPTAFVAADDAGVVGRHEEVPWYGGERLPPRRVGVEGPARAASASPSCACRSWPPMSPQYVGLESYAASSETMDDVTEIRRGTLQEQTFYEQVGGEKTFRRLVHRFYEGVAQDPLLRPMY